MDKNSQKLNSLQGKETIITIETTNPVYIIKRSRKSISG